MIYKIYACEMSVLSVVSRHLSLCIIQTIMKEYALIVIVWAHTLEFFAVNGIPSSGLL